ncbi:MAG: EamA family transporter [Deltaproteobacteria bacterium]|nr:EamA family transporter [Deltaproteobacteria bacterium]
MSQELQTGIYYALFAGGLWGIGPLLLKRGLKYADVSTATLVEQHVSVFLLVGLAIYYGEIGQVDPSSRAFWAFFLAGAIGASFGKVFYYRGIDLVGASKATSVKNGSPLLTVILAVLFLGEEMSWLIVAGVTLIVVGIAVLSQAQTSPAAGTGRFEYLLFPLIAAFCFGINPIFKKIGISAAGLPVLGALVTQTTALLCMLAFGRFMGLKVKRERVPLRGLLFFALSGITEAVGSLCTFFALIYGPAALLSPIWRISPLVTFALARFTLKGIEVVTLRDGVAASLIVAGVFVLSRG